MSEKYEFEPEKVADENGIQTIETIEESTAENSKIDAVRLGKNGCVSTAVVTRTMSRAHVPFANMSFPSPNSGSHH